MALAPMYHTYSTGVPYPLTGVSMDIRSRTKARDNADVKTINQMWPYPLGETHVGSDNTVFMFVLNDSPTVTLAAAATDAAPAGVAVSSTTFLATAGAGWFALSPFPPKTAGWVYKKPAF
jgi:hypothetical protein